MIALFIRAPGDAALGEVPLPVPKPGEVLLRVRLAGFCGSDLNTFRGSNPLVSYPRIPGHEVAAVVDRVGAGVPDSFRPGMPVAVSPYTACGACASCRRGRPNACRDNQTLGVQRDGAMAEFIALPWQRLHPAEGLSFRELCLVEPLSVGFHAVARGRVAAAESVVVLGCGAIGLGAVAAAAFRGARTIAVDIDPAKLVLAHKAGASHAIDSAAEDLPERVGELTGGDGADVVIEAVGLPLTFRQAVDLVAFTGRVVYIGYAKEPVAYESRWFVQKELDLLGSRNATPRDFDGVVEMLRQGRFPVDDAVTAVAPLESAVAALQAWHTNPLAFTKIHVEICGSDR
ncbi:MAG: zinc-binding alcohol dehydrogenase family protein [Bryobacteraceae bacterium]|nr:zinc-binding alcohol dehydrogenase family protein [Bryobacteraceae bacterium]